MLRILLADDHAMFRSGLRRILEAEFPGASVGEAATIAELQERLGAQAWDVLLLDISMAGQNSLNALPPLKERHPRLPVVVLSMYGDRQFVIQALRAGASAYLTKERAPEELIRAIRSVLAGRRYVGDELAEQLADHLAGGGTGSPHERLSPRELEIFLQLAAARSVSEIAERLELSVKTVSTYRSRILEKMALRSNAELMQYAVRHGLVG
ncbi:response regulator transcription factor [Anaeromyxobacter sp. PSR-1]|uniref:response regulator n=1 Tax=unclassified Anaeromyxobacter TaxID=2620896 RepID=UPI0005E496E7|nr:response regulator transcription factor [Anaeromyxobacter sp. PSR-1]GAO01854.1 response regulator UvrY [Anaeromyxobacter sp. PSR-1]